MTTKLQMTKEEIYDANIAPLMTLIIAICQRANIDFAASFALDEDDGAGPSEPGTWRQRQPHWLGDI